MCMHEIGDCLLLFFVAMDLKCMARMLENKLQSLRWPLHITCMLQGVFSICRQFRYLHSVVPHNYFMHINKRPMEKTIFVTV